MLVKSIKINDILVDQEWNCRGELVPFDVMSLAKDIEKKGLIQPIVVREGDFDGKPYKLIAGFRRTLACTVLGREEVDAVVRTDITDEEAFVINLTENINRENLTIAQEAKSIERLIKNKDITYTEIGKMLSKTATWVQLRQMYLMVEPEVQEAMLDGKITQHQLRVIAKQPPERQKLTVLKVKEAIERGLKSSDVVDSKPKPNKNSRAKRTNKQINDMKDYLTEQLGTNPASRALAWSQGIISDAVFFEDFAGLEPPAEWYDEDPKDEHWLSKYRDD